MPKEIAIKARLSPNWFPGPIVIGQALPNLITPVPKRSFSA